MNVSCEPCETREELGVSRSNFKITDVTLASHWIVLGLSFIISKIETVFPNLPDADG